MSPYPAAAEFSAGSAGIEASIPTGIIGANQTGIVGNHSSIGRGGGGAKGGKQGQKTHFALEGDGGYTMCKQLEEEDNGEAGERIEEEDKKDTSSSSDDSSTSDSDSDSDADESSDEDANATPEKPRGQTAAVIEGALGSHSTAGDGAAPRSQSADAEETGADRVGRQPPPPPSLPPTAKVTDALTHNL